MRLLFAASVLFAVVLLGAGPDEKVKRENNPYFPDTVLAFNGECEAERYTPDDWEQVWRIFKRKAHHFYWGLGYVALPLITELIDERGYYDGGYGFVMRRSYIPPPLLGEDPSDGLPGCIEGVRVQVWLDTVPTLDWWYRDDAAWWNPPSSDETYFWERTSLE